ncbi:MAG: archaeosortase/exosortase family protein [Dechloromonas sp.]|nr:MAG: archaeosortase/exosortase family protein [Dechloromonas sp.]
MAGLLEAFSNPLIDVFMLPSGDFLQPILRQLTVNIIEIFATAVGLPHQVEGFQIAIGESDYIVLNECAGLPYFCCSHFWVTLLA